MKDALRYELKQILLPLVIFTGAAAAVCLIYSGTQSLEYPRFDAEGIYAADSCVMASTALLAVLCTVTPVMQFSYRMKKRSVDLWYSLPLSRTRLAAVKTVGGLVLTLIGELVLYFAYRRSFRLKRADIISVAVSLVIAVALFFALPMN